MGGGTKSGAKARTVEPKDTRAEYTMEAFDAFIAKNEPMDAVIPAVPEHEINVPIRTPLGIRKSKEKRIVPAQPEQPVTITFGQPWNNQSEKGEKNVYAYVKKPGEKFGEKVKLGYGGSGWNAGGFFFKEGVYQKLVREAIDKKIKGYKE